jgi:hypothetical protein
VTYSVDDLASVGDFAVLFRVASDTPIRLWSGHVRDLPIPAGGAEDTDGAIYESHGQLVGVPQFTVALNGEADRVDFSMSWTGITGEIAAALAASRGAEIRGKATDVGLVLFDEDMQPVAPVWWLASYTADSLTFEKGGTAAAQTRTAKLACGNVFSARKRPSLSYFTDIDQKRRSSDDAFCDQVTKYYSGSTVVWGQS